MKKVEKNPLAMAIITFIACILAILLVMGVISLISKKPFAEGIDPTIIIIGGIASVGSAVAEYLNVKKKAGK